MGGLIRAVRSGPWYVRAVVAVAVATVLMWPVLVDQGAHAVVGLVAVVPVVLVVGAIEDARLREQTGWDRERRVRELARVRGGVLPADPADRRRVATLLANRRRQGRGADWVLLCLLLANAGLVLVRRDRYPSGLAPVAAAWFVLVGVGVFVVVRRAGGRDADLSAAVGDGRGGGGSAR